MPYSSQNIDALFSLIGELPAHEHQQSSHFEYLKTADSFWPNLIYNFKASPSELNPLLHQMEKEVEQGIIPPVLRIHASEISTESLAQIIKRGYKQSTWTCMSHSLNYIEEEQSSPEFKIVKLTTANQLEDWLKIVELELMRNNLLSRASFEALLADQSCHFYLGYFRQKPVSTALLFEHQNNAGIYLVATDSNHRRKGYGQALTLKCLQEAQAHNCQKVDIQATSLGLSMYQSLGFSPDGLIHVFSLKDFPFR